MNDSITQRLVREASQNCAAGKGLRALIWVLAVAKRPSLQKLQAGWAVELCPSYLRTLDGITHWAARQAWPVAERILDWAEMDAQTARGMGMTLRACNKRRGRLLMLADDALQQLEKAQEILCSHKTAYRAELSDTRTLEHTLHVEPNTRRCFAVRCPNHENHKRRDRKPSLVLWRNTDGVTGGARCMVCQRDHMPRTWAVEFNGSEVKLFSPRSKASVPRSFSHSRNNKQSLSTPTGTHRGKHVGGRVTHREKRAYHCSAVLEGYGSGSSYALARRVVGESKRDVLDVLEWHERRSAGPAATQRAQFAAWLGSVDEREKVLPTKILSVTHMRLSRSLTRSDALHSVTQRWVLLDVDRVSMREESASDIAAGIARVVRRDAQCSGRLAVVKTGPTGLHVWVELRVARHSPVAWHRDEAVMHWYSSLGARVLAAAHRAGAMGGYVDMACCAAGRFGRKPSWRLLDDGTAYRSRLLLIVRDRLRSTEIKHRVKPAPRVKGNAEAVDVCRAEACSTTRTTKLADRVKVPRVPARLQQSPIQRKILTRFGEVEQHEAVTTRLDPRGHVLRLVRMQV